MFGNFKFSRVEIVFHNFFWELVYFLADILIIFKFYLFLKK